MYSERFWWAKLIYIDVMLALVSIKVDNIHSPPLLRPAGLYTIRKQYKIISPVHTQSGKTAHTHTKDKTQCLIFLLMSSMSTI